MTTTWDCTCVTHKSVLTSFLAVDFVFTDFFFFERHKIPFTSTKQLGKSSTLNSRTIQPDMAIGVYHDFLSQSFLEKMYPCDLFPKNRFGFYRFTYRFYLINIHKLHLRFPAFPKKFFFFYILLLI